MRSNRPKVAVIGVGGIAEVAHIPGYYHAGADIVAVCSNHPEKIQTTVDHYGIKQVFTEYSLLLEVEDIEAVSVCVPTQYHAEITIAALKAGKHVLCEKPPAISANEAIKMQVAAKENNRLLMYAFSARFRNEAQKLKGFADKDLLGDIYGAKVGWMRRRGNPAGWFTEKRRSGGGALIDLGVHGLDLAWWIMGRPRAIAASGAIYQKFGNYSSDNAVTPDPVMQRHVVRQPKTLFDVEDSAFAMVRFANGSHLTLEASWALNCPGESRYATFYGTKGGAELSKNLKIYSEIENTLVDIEAQVPQGNAYQNQLEHFVAVLKGEEEPISTAEDGVAIMKMTDAIYQSAASQQEVPIAFDAWERIS